MDSEYQSFDYRLHRHLDYWDAINMCAPIATVAVLLFVVMVFVPFTSVAMAIFFFIMGCLFCCGRLHPRFRILALARRARLDIKRQPTLTKQLEGKESKNDSTMQQDWRTASGQFCSLDHPEAGTLELEFAPFEVVFLPRDDKKLWNIIGHAKNGGFAILHGLIAENGKLYWMERHEGIVPGTEGCNPSPPRLVLVQGILDHATHRFEGTWTDSLGCRGTYATLVRQDSGI